jgi:hypothetical protein
MAIGDINGDGKPDIIATDEADVGVFENIYSGGVFDSNAFIPAYQLQGTGISTYPTSPLIADINGDKKPEIVIGFTNTSPNRISIYENKNVNAPAISISTVSPLAAPVGATITITEDHFSTVPTENNVMIGGVKATVLSASKTQLTATVPSSTQYGFVSVTRDQLTSTYRLPFKTTFSQGVDFNAAHFAAPVSYTLTGANYDLDFGDLNRDGKADIIAEGSGATYAFKNTYSNGPINTSTLLPDDTLAASFTNPKLHDLDGDGLMDIVAVNGLTRKNNSLFSEISFLPNVSLAGGASNVDYGDFNMDGKIDMALTSGVSAQLLLIENRTISVPGNFTTGTFGSFSPSYSFTKPSTGGGIVAGDFDNDGFHDVITTNPGADNLSVFRNMKVLKISAAQFAPRVDIATGDNPGRVYIGDLDVDGKQDLVLYHGPGTNANTIAVFHNQSTLGNISFNRMDLTIPSASTVAHISDLDGDGKPEIIATSEAGNQFTIFKNNCTPGAINASSFGAPFNTIVTAPRGLTTGDINLDGKPEIVITRAAGFLLVYENLISAKALTITTQPESKSVCAVGNATLTVTATGASNITYQWQKLDPETSVHTNLANGAEYLGATTATLTILDVSVTDAGSYRCVVSGDNEIDQVSNDAQMTVGNPLPPVVDPVSTCSGSSAEIIASGGVDGQYRWYTVGTAGVAIPGEINKIYHTPVLHGQTAYWVAINNGSCESLRTEVIVAIHNLPTKPLITSSSDVLCTGRTLTLSAPSGFTYLWSNGMTTQEISTNTEGNFSVQVTNGFGCSATSDVLTLTPVNCNEPPVIVMTTIRTIVEGSASLNLLPIISDPDNNLNLSTITIVKQPISGAEARIDNNHNLVVDYSGMPFTGLDELTIEACDDLGVCVTQKILVDVIGEIIVYNGLSPNQDGKNDTW